MGQVVLTFGQLADANGQRMRMFTNNKGELAHPKGGDDWDRSEWLEAMVGELGEYCNDSKKFRRGDLTKEEFRLKAMEEIGGTLLYMDLLCKRISEELGEPFELGHAAAYEFNRKSAQLDLPIFITFSGAVLYQHAKDMVWDVPGVEKKS